MSENQIEVVTNKKQEVFNLLELPDPKSQLIRTECLTIKKDTNFESLTSDFANLSDLIRLAENGACNHCEIQIQIRDVGRIITQLAGDTSLAIHAFEKTSTEMAETWRTTYEYLLSSFEEEALIMLNSIEELAKNMLEISIKLKKDANIAGDKVKDISNTARRRREEDVKNKNKIDKRKDELINEEKMWKVNEEIAQKCLDNLETEIKEKTKYVEEAENYISSWGIFSIFFKFSKINLTAKKEREEKRQLIEELRRQIAVRRETNEKIAAFSKSISNCEIQSVLENDVIKSLDHAFSALNSIEGIIEAARMFWEKMYVHFKQFTNQKIDRIIKDGLKKDDEHKQNLYRSPIFKRQVVNVYAKCIAIKETCLEYKELMEENHINLVKYLKENPSREQSNSIVKNLSQKLLKNTEITNENLRREEEELNEQEANLYDDIQANMKLNHDDLD